MQESAKRLTADGPIQLSHPDSYITCTLKLHYMYIKNIYNHEIADAIK